MVQEDNELCFNPLKFQERPTSIFLNTILFHTSLGEIREIWELMKWTSRGNALIIYQIITTKFFMEIKQISWEIFMWILGVEGLNNMDTSLKMDTMLLIPPRPSLNLRWLLWVIFSSQQHLNPPAINVYLFHCMIAIEFDSGVWLLN